MRRTCPMTDLLEYLTGLAPEGETALIVRQKPIVRDGQHLTHRDGTPKYTWPAYLPGHRRRDGESWFINTGAFILDRFTDGKPSASAANCEYVLFMMLDDIGTKSKEPPVPPTWVIETSPDNFQWGYAFREQPTKGEYVAAITAIAGAGYTDPGATNAVRNCRLPGSVNQKPGREAFAARLTAFHPEREFTLPELCAAFGVVPAEAEGAAVQGIKIRDTGSDSVLRWLSDQGLVLSKVNPEGWCGVVCPNHAAHSDGQIEGRYSPINRAFCCYHAHCDALDSNAFLAWVAAQGGPAVQPGFREELVAERMAKVAETIQPTEAFPDVAAEVVAAVDRKELGRLTKREWFSRFAYVVSDDSYFDLERRTEMSRAAFNAVFRHVDCKSIHNQRKVEAATCFDENRQ
ncbi:MAG: DNA-primase RepB domain-containing protein, partial [Phycisphaerae bacterium]